MSENRIQFTLKVAFDVTRDEVGFVSHCPGLDVFSQGKTAESAVANLREAIELFIETCFEDGTLLDVLGEGGYKPGRKQTRISKVPMMEIPFFLVSHGPARAN